MIAEMADGIIFDGSTSAIEIQPGVTYINEDNAGALTMTYNTDYREAIIRTGNAPAGNYTFCISVVDAEMEQPLAKNCIRFEVEKPSPPELVSPVDGLTIEEELPVFTWTPPMPMLVSHEIKYRFIIAEIFDFQTSYEAMISNPWFIEENVMETSLVYPIGARQMIPDNKYCWMVQSLDPDGNPIGQNNGRSEIFTFVYKEKEPEIPTEHFQQTKSITLISPLAECVGHVTQFENNPTVSFQWTATGDFTYYNVIIYENPCGKWPHPQPPTVPPPLPPTIPTTPPGSPTGTTPTGPVPMPSGPVNVNPFGPGGSNTGSTTGGQTTTPAPIPETPIPGDTTTSTGGGDDDLGGSDDVPPLPPGWKWGDEGPECTGEYPPEPPALPPGWGWTSNHIPEWIGEGEPVPRLVAGMSEPISDVSATSIAQMETYTCEMNIAGMVEPGAAFIYQVQGTTVLPDGSTQSMLSDDQCLRFMPVSADGTEPGEVECIQNCTVAPEMQLEYFDINVLPTDMKRMLPDDPLPLKVFSNDRHCLIQKCYCQAGYWSKIHKLQALVRYEWKITSGDGGFIKINESGDAKSEFGQDVLYNPPEIDDTITEKTIQIEVKAFHDDPSKSPYHDPLTANLTIKIKREIKDKDKWKSTSHEFTDPGEIEDRYVYKFTLTKPEDIFKKCPDIMVDECSPVHQWKKGSDLDGDIVIIPDEACYGDHIRLEAKGSDTDDLDLICIPTGKVCKGPDKTTLTFNDYLDYEWSAGNGSFPLSTNGREVTWQAPDVEGEFTITLTIKDTGGQYDDKDKIIKKKIRINKLGIDMVKVNKDWLPNAANGRVPGYVKPMIYVCKNGKWETNGRRKIIYTKLKNLSREPGLCMNFPPQPPNLSANIILNRNPDMFFDETENKTDWILLMDTTTTFKNPTKIIFDGDNPSHDHHYLFAASKKRATNLMPSIRVEDYGAYAKTEATANHCKPILPRETANDPPCQTTNDCCEDDNTVKLPRDDNFNDIADGADQDKNAPATTDDDRSVSPNPLNGDGLTNYQEYRGFIISVDKKKRLHRRTDTNLKDLFIRNEANLPLTYFQSSGLGLKEINENSLWQLSDLQLILSVSNPSHGVSAAQLHPIEINYNRCKNEKHCPKTNAEDDWGEQHGLWLAVDNTMRGLFGICEADSPRMGGADFFILPKIVYRVALNQTDIAARTAGTPAVLIPNVLEKSVAHELGHGVNVMHHGDMVGKFFAPGAQRVITVGGVKTVVDRGGNTIPVYYVYGHNGQTSGPTNCVMLYDNRDGWYNEARTVLYEDLNRNRRYDPGIDIIYLVRATDGKDYKVCVQPIHKYNLPHTVGNTFCSDRIETNWNRSTRNGGAPTLPAGVERNLANPSDKNGCRQQIRVKSWKLTP
jgi:hypothetical protein